MAKFEVSAGVNARRRSLRAGFTLVELLVVIGIIALLIAILLPTLAGARENAKRAACLAKLQQIMVAANLHAVEHKGYFPLAGQLNGTGGQMTPVALNDTYTSHYTYSGYTGLTNNGGDIRILAPITIALGTEMGFTKNLSYMDNPSQAAGDSDNLGLTRHFLCPSQASATTDITQICWFYAGTFGNYYGGYTGSISYMFNEAVLGYDDAFGRLHGQTSQIRQPAKTMFAADGQGGSLLTRLSGTWRSFNDPGGPPPPFSTITVWNKQATPPVTLSDALTWRHSTPKNNLIAGDPDNFDQLRHRGKINIAFCDGHAETRTLPTFTYDPTSGVPPVFKSDPTAANLMTVYLLAP